MTTVTDLPSGQRLVSALQTLTRSERVMACPALALLETRARSRAEARDAVIVMSTNMETRRKR